MYKVIWFMKRRADLTHAEFRTEFERTHATLAQRHCGHLFADYRRNYVDTVWRGGDPRIEGSGYRETPWEWDLISEWVMPDEAAFQEIIRIMAEPGVVEEFRTDEDRIMDRSATVMLPCVVADTGPDGRGTGA